MFASGSILCFGAYRLIKLYPTQLATLAQVLIPVLHLAAAFGLMEVRTRARHLTCFLAFFYLGLGILVFADSVSVRNFLPIAPLIQFVPTAFLLINLRIYVVSCFLVLPALILGIVSLRATAAAFKSGPEGRFSWQVPLAVLVASHFALAYAFLAHSEIYFFIRPEPRLLFSFPLTPAQGLVVQYLEFCLPLVLGFGLLAANPWFACFALVLGVYYGLPYWLGGFGGAHLYDAKFLIFGAGWIFVLLTVIFYWGFFWQPGEWLEKRSERKLNRAPSFVFWILSLLLAVTVTAFWLQGRILSEKRDKTRVAESMVFQKELHVSKPNFKLEGTSIDAQGSYAIVDGNVMQAGALVRGYQVEVIEPHRILVSKGPLRYWLDDQGKVTKARQRFD